MVRRAGLSPQLQRWKDHQDRQDPPRTEGPSESTHLSAAAQAKRRDTISKWGVISGFALFGGGLITAFGAAATLAASAPVWMALGAAVALGGVATAFASSVYGGGSSLRPCGLDNLANPGNPVHQLMNQTIFHI